MKPSLAIVLAVITLGAITFADAEIVAVTGGQIRGAILDKRTTNAESQQANLALFGIAHGIDSRVASLTSAEPDPCITGTGGRSGRTCGGEGYGHQSGSLRRFERTASDQPDGWREEFLRQVRWLATERE